METRATTSYEPENYAIPRCLHTPTRQIMRRQVNREDTRGLTQSKSKKKNSRETERRGYTPTNLKDGGTSGGMDSHRWEHRTCE